MPDAFKHCTTCSLLQATCSRLQAPCHLEYGSSHGECVPPCVNTPKTLLLAAQAARWWTAPSRVLLLRLTRGVLLGRVGHDPSGVGGRVLERHDHLREHRLELHQPTLELVQAGGVLGH
eukprot:3188663-Alexandrium_andersonii.AAC.1